MATTADLMHLALLRLGRSSTGLRWEIQDLQIYKKNWKFHPALLSNERRCAINEKSSMDSTGKQTTVKGRHTWYWDDPIHQYNLLCVSFLKLTSCQNPTHMVVVRWSNRWQRPHSTQPLESVSASTRTAMKPMAISGSGLYFTGCECSAIFSVPKWKTSCSQSELLFQDIFNVKKFLIGWACFLSFHFRSENGQERLESFFK